MGPRSDFRCTPCAKAQGAAEVIHQDLPIESRACPITGKRRGFQRILSANVSTIGHKVAKILDPVMRPHFDQARALQDAAREGEARLREDHERSGLNRVVPAPIQAQRAAQVLGTVDPAARADSREYTMPLIRRRVVPRMILADRGD